MGHTPWDQDSSRRAHPPNCLLHVTVLKDGETEAPRGASQAGSVHWAWSPGRTPPRGPCHLGILVGSCLMGSPKLLSEQRAAPALLAPLILLVIPAVAKEKCFTHFNQCFILDLCPLKGFPQGQDFKNRTNKYKGNEHRRLAGGQAEESRARATAYRADSSLRPPNPRAVGATQPSDLHCRGPPATITPSLTWWCRYSLAHLLPIPAAPLCAPQGRLPSLPFPHAVQGGADSRVPERTHTENGSSPDRKSTSSNLLEE